MTYIQPNNAYTPSKSTSRDQALNKAYSKLPDLFIGPSLISIIISNQAITHSIQPHTQAIRFTKNSITFQINDRTFFQPFEIKPNENCVYFQKKVAQSTEISHLIKQLETFIVDPQWIRKEKTTATDAIMKHDRLIHTLFKLKEDHYCYPNTDTRLIDILQETIADIRNILHHQLVIIKKKETRQANYNKALIEDKKKKKTGNYYLPSANKKMDPIHKTVDDIPTIIPPGVSA